MYNRLKLVSLTANTELTQEIAKYIGIDVMKTQCIKFADNELMFESEESFRGDDVFIVQSTCNPVNDNLMQLLLAVDACRRAGAHYITCVIPYFGYARQDRKAKARQPISAKLVANLLTTAGAKRVVGCDFHCGQLAGFFDIPVNDITPLPLFVKYIKGLKLDNLVCVSPDHGGVVRNSKLAAELNAPLAIIDKRRPRPNEAEVIGIVGDIKDKNCIIYDDLVDTAGTLCNAISKLKELGAKKIYAFASHGVLSGPAIDRINNSAVERLVITNSIPLAENKKSPKIEVLSLAPLLATIIMALEDGVSISEALDEISRKINK